MCFPTLLIVKFIKWLMRYKVFHVCQKEKSPYFLAVHIQSVIIAYWEGIQILITHMQLLLYEYKSCLLSNCCIVCEFYSKRIWFSIYYVWAIHYWWKIVPLFPAKLKIHNSGRGVMLFDFYWSDFSHQYCVINYTTAFWSVKTSPFSSETLS